MGYEGGFDGGFCPQHGYVPPEFAKVKHEGRQIFYVCPICGDDLEDDDDGE